MARGRIWTRNEYILALRLYFQIPYSKIDRHTPEIIKLAELLDRSPNSIALRLANFVACDPVMKASGKKGLDGGLKGCIPYWNEFADRREALNDEAEKIKLSMEKNSMKTNEQSEIEENSNLSYKNNIAEDCVDYSKRDINVNDGHKYILAFPDDTNLIDDNCVNLLVAAIKYAGVVGVNRLQLTIKDLNLVSRYKYVDSQINIGYGWYTMTDGTVDDFSDCINKISEAFGLELRFSRVMDV